jgi:transposase
VTAGQVHESTRLESAMDQVAVPQPLGRPRTRPNRLAGDKAYRGRRIRDWLRARRAGRVIPGADNERARDDGRVKFDKLAYERRSIIENCVGWLKECRRIATRFEKLAVNYLAMLKLAMIERCLRLIQFSDRA